MNWKKDFYKLLNNAFYAKTMKNIRNRIRLEIFKNDDTKKIITQQPKIPFNGIHKSHGNCDSYTIKQKEILKDKPIYLGFAKLELSKLHMYKTYYDELQSYVGQENIQLHNVGTDAFLLSVNTENIIKDLKNLGDIFDFTDLDENHEFFCNKMKKVIGKFQLKTPKIIGIDEFVCLRSNFFSFKCGNNIINKLKAICKSQSKHIKFEEYKICLDEEYQKDCQIYIIRSINHEMYLQKVRKSILSSFDDKRCYINETESKPWT